MPSSAETGSPEGQLEQIAAEQESVAAADGVPAVEFRASLGLQPDGRAVRTEGDLTRCAGLVAGSRSSASSAPGRSFWLGDGEWFGIGPPGRRTTRGGGPYAVSEAAEAGLRGCRLVRRRNPPGVPRTAGRIRFQAGCRPGHGLIPRSSYDVA